jgi:diguanylate cyclase (GGDEF)-like protein
MPNTTLDSAIKIIERVKNKIKEKFKEITISAGIVSYPEDGKTRTELIDKADILLLQAKKKKDIILTTLDTNYNF